MDFYALKVKLKNVDSVIGSVTVMQHILSIINDPELTSTKLAEYVKNDQALASKILKLSNSAFYGFSRKIETIRDAISLLGYNTIKSVVLSMSFQQMIDKFDISKDFLDNYAKHSMLTGLITEKISSENSIEPDVAFLSGLFHDIGKIAMMQFFPDDYLEIIDAATESNVELFEYEEKTLGFSHQNVGKLLLENWELPKVYQEVAENHHHTVNNFSSLSDYVAIADRMARYFDYADSGNRKEVVFTDFENDIFKKLENKAENILKFLDEIWN